MDDHPSPEEDQPTPDSNPPKKRSLKARLVEPGVLFWLMEFLVVFAGVFCAFLLSEYRANREEQEQRDKIMESLLVEVDYITSFASRMHSRLSKVVSRYDSAMQADSPLRLEPVVIASLSGIQLGYWETARVSGAVNVLDFETLNRFNNFHTNLSEAIDFARHASRLSESMLLPNADAPVSDFYDLQTNELRPQYRWWMTDLRGVATNMKTVVRQGKKLLADLRPEWNGGQQETIPTEALPDSANQAESLNTDPDPDS